MGTPKLVLLDFDGVVIEGTNQAYFDCYHRALEAVGVVLDSVAEQQSIVQYWGSGHVKQLEMLLQKHPAKVSEAARVWETCVEAPTFWDNARLIDGSQEAIAQMSRQVPVVMVSGARKRHIRRLIKRDQIDGVSAVYSSYDVKPALRKPHPHMLELALAKFNVAAADAIYVGDMRNDVVMARAASVEPVVVLTGVMTREDAAREEVTLIADNLLAVAEQLFPS